MRLFLVLLAPLVLSACHSQPSITETNASTTAQLNTIAANTNETDGMDQGNAVFMRPTTGPGSPQGTGK